jgi:hypothetical protein
MTATKTCSALARLMAPALAAGAAMPYGDPRYDPYANASQAENDRCWSMPIGVLALGFPVGAR